MDLNAVARVFGGIGARDASGPDRGCWVWSLHRLREYHQSASQSGGSPMQGDVHSGSSRSHAAPADSAIPDGEPAAGGARRSSGAGTRLLVHELAEPAP